MSKKYNLCLNEKFIIICKKKKDGQPKQAK